MKFVKRITALFLALTMVMAMGITAFAADTTYKITAPDDGHTYKVYQIYTGDLSGTTLSNIRYGKNHKSYDSSETTQDLVAANELTTVQALASNTQATATAIHGYLAENTTAVAELKSGSLTADVAPGYYLIEDAGVVDGTTDSYSTYIVSVVKDLTFTAKRDVPTFEKKVDDVNDSTGTSETLKDSADYDIGDSVPFTLTGTIPSNYADYTTYYYQFTDQMEKSLTFNEESVKVYLNEVKNENDITSLFTVANGESVSSQDLYNGGTKFTVTCDDLKTNTTIKAGDKIIVKYNATLNENANIGAPGNFNEAKLTYSNNPNNSGDGDNNHGETPWDNVVVFTYQTIVDKVDQDKQPLANAEFTLYKFVANESGSTTYKTVKGDWTESKKASLNDNKTTFTFTGLDDGYYKLSETKTPAGYNTVADIEFEVEADHTLDFTTYQAARDNDVAEVNGTAILTLNDPDGTGDTWSVVNNTSVKTQVENRKGSTLPSTGGMGTTVLYIAGIAMIVVAGVVVIARKRNA